MNNKETRQNKKAYVAPAILNKAVIEPDQEIAACTAWITAGPFYIDEQHKGGDAYYDHYKSRQAAIEAREQEKIDSPYYQKPYYETWVLQAVGSEHKVRIYDSGLDGVYSPNGQIDNGWGVDYSVINRS